MDGDGDDLLEGVAFSTPSNQRVLIIRNGYPARDTYELEVEVSDRPGQALHLMLEPKSITTIVWDKV